MWRILSRLDAIEPRWFYSALFAVVAAPLFIHLNLPMPARPETKAAYDAIENAPRNKLIVIESDWDQGSRGENMPQLQAILDHLMREGRKFAFVSAIPTATPFSEHIAQLVARKYGRRYGVDWVDWGYKIPLAAAGPSILALSRNIPKAVPTDIYGTPITDIPVMRDVKDASDIALVINVAYDVRLEWIQLVQGVYGTPMISACASITSTTNYPLFLTKQLSGMLVGVRGAAEYEQLIHVPAGGTRLIQAQSFGHLLLLIGIVLGNIGWRARQRLERR